MRPMRTIAKIQGWLPQYRSNLTLAVPVILSQVGQVIVQLVDNAMVGQLGAVPLAAVSFGGAIFTTFMMWGMGLSLGLTPLVGEAYSKGNTRDASSFFRSSMILFFGVGLLLFGVLLGIGAFMDRMGQDPAVAAIAKPYYNYLAWSIIPYMIFTSFKQFLEGVGNTRTGMVVVLSSNCLNIGLNYFLIYGNLGFPEMGAAGAGLATLISRICMPLMMVVYFIRNHSMRRYIRLFKGVRRSWQWTMKLLRVGLPISAQVLMEILAFSVTLIMMGWIGAIELAAHQIAISMSHMTFMIFTGIASATTIMVSHSYGIGDLKGLRRAASASYHLGILFTLTTMMVFILLRNYIPMIFTNDQAVIAVASHLFIFAGLYQVADGLQVISLGILRGLQDVRITMIYAFISYIAINLPVGYLCAFVLKLGAPGLWIGFIVGLTTAAVLLYRRYRKLYRRLSAL